MAIGNAVQRGMTVYVYNEKGHQICTIPVNSSSDVGLKGYTGSTVSVQRGNIIYTYDEKGKQISTIPAK